MLELDFAASDGFGSTEVRRQRSKYPLRSVVVRPVDPRGGPSGASPVAVAYALGYGGGVVGGDRTQTRIRVGCGASAAVLTQGSTKLFGARDGAPDSELTVDLEVAAGARLYYLPDPASLYAGCRHRQSVRAVLADRSASLCLIDAFGAGRAALGERWGHRRFVNDLQLHVLGGAAESSAAPLYWDRLDLDRGPLASFQFDLLVTCLLWGPEWAAAIAALAERARARRRSHDASAAPQPSSLLWTFVPLGPHGCSACCGGALRIAAESLHEARGFLWEAALGPVLAGRFGKHPPPCAWFFS